MFKLTFILSIVFFATMTFAQDVHLSQFYTADQLLNPARIGAHGGDLRASANYRNQWRQINSSPLKTFVVDVDKLFHFGKHDVVFGGMVIRDQFSGFQTITNKLMAAGSYGYNLFGFKLRGGLQLGFVTNSTDLSIQTYPNQWNYPGGTFDQGLPNGEQNLRPSQNYLDVNSGFTIAKKINGIDFETGFSFNHLNRPKDTYFDKFTQRRKVRGVFHGTAIVPINALWKLEPKIQWMWTNKANDFLFGSLGRYKTDFKAVPITSVFGGLMYRHGVNRTVDAIYPVVGCVVKEFEIGASYDINVSSLSDGVRRLKSFELSVIYTIPSSAVKYKILPCERY